MRDRGGELLEATLPVQNLGAEQVLMMAIERVAFKVFVGSISQGNCSTRQHVLDPSAKARLFLLCRVQSKLDCLQNGADAQPVGFSIPLGRAGFEILTAQAASKVVMRAGPQKQLKSSTMSGASRGR